MSFGENIAPLLGRCLMALFFALVGLEQLRDWAAWRITLLSHGLSPPDVALVIAVIIELGGAFALAIGFRTRLAALALFLLTVAASLVLNDFWEIEDAELARVQLELFLRNVAIAGGLLIVVGMGAGRWSYDTWRES
jgi:putative oxidoreductase